MDDPREISKEAAIAALDAHFPLPPADAVGNEAREAAIVGLAARGIVHDCIDHKTGLLSRSQLESKWINVAQVGE